MRHTRVLSRSSAVVVTTAALVLIGCRGASPETSVEQTTTSKPPAEPAAEPPLASPLRPPPCAAGAANCEDASGVIIYVERVDADGDGDAHFVLASAESITGPGISVIDVAVDLRPHPLPKPGERLAASGPVYSGSYGQKQVQATEIRMGASPGP